MAPHSSTLAWKIPWTEEPGRLQPMGSLRVGHDWVTSLSLFTVMHWRRKWPPTPVFLPGESQGWGSLVGCHLWSQTQLKRLSSSSKHRDLNVIKSDSKACYHSLYYTFSLSIRWNYWTRYSLRPLPILTFSAFPSCNHFTGKLTLFFPCWQSEVLKWVLWLILWGCKGFPGGSSDKELASNA